MGTLPALFPQAVRSRKAVYQGARKRKLKTTHARTEKVDCSTLAAVYLLFLRRWGDSALKVMSFFAFVRSAVLPKQNICKMFSSRNIAGGLQDVYIELFLDSVSSIL